MNTYYILNFIYPRNMSMEISTSIHKYENDVWKELNSIGYEDDQVVEILSGETYADPDDESWVKVTKVSV